MVLANHIAHTFLTSSDIQIQILNEYFPEEYAKIKKLQNQGLSKAEFDEEVNKDKTLDKFWVISSLVFNEQNYRTAGASLKTFLVTQTVLDCFEYLKMKRQPNGHYNWAVFKSLSPFQKVTFILPGNKMIRVEVLTEVINFCYVEHHKDKQGGAIEGRAKWELFFVNRITGQVSSNFERFAVTTGLDTFIYKLLCFVYLADNEEIVLTAGKSYGEKKTGKTLNNTPYPVTIINSCWNITAIRNEEFGVSGHFHIYHVGKGRTDWIVKFVEPFTKTGYVRVARSLTQN